MKMTFFCLAMFIIYFTQCVITLTDADAADILIGKIGKLKHKNRYLVPDSQCGVAIGARVLGGDVAALEDHPWMALLRLRFNGKKVYTCTGILISSKYVLAPAHCFNGTLIPKSATMDKVRLGEHDLSTSIDCTPDGICSPPTQNIDIEKTIVHPMYKSSSVNGANDIALIRLHKEAKFSAYVQPICLPLDLHPRKNLDGIKLTAVGWRQPKRHSKKLSHTVKSKVELPAIGNKECSRKYGNEKINITDSQLCAGGEETMARDSCYGIASGPLMSREAVEGGPKWFVVGIGIFNHGSKKCASKDKPEVYTRVSMYSRWILDNMQP